MSNFELVLPPGVDQQEILTHLLQGNVVINENNELIIQTTQPQPTQQPQVRDCSLIVDTFDVAFILYKLSQR